MSELEVTEITDPATPGVTPPGDEVVSSEDAIHPTAEELAALTRFERFAFLLAHRMNQGRLKQFWTWCQSTIGAGWIHLSTYNILRVYGLENLETVSHDRPLLLVANHRSFFDMYTVSTVLFRQAKWRKQLFFPVRGRFFYTSPLGPLVNFIMGWWSMYPPFFAVNEKRSFDKYSLRRLAGICRSGAGNVIGFHPEGTRNRSADPYSLLRAQPGIGRLIKESSPQVIPVFIAGLDNSLPRQIIRNWTDGEKIRIHFGRKLELARFLEMKDHVRTYKQIGDYVMSEIAVLGESDRSLYGQACMTQGASAVSKVGDVNE